jgi:hypothetical protein
MRPPGPRAQGVKYLQERQLDHAGTAPLTHRFTPQCRDTRVC